MPCLAQLSKPITLARSDLVQHMISSPAKQILTVWSFHLDTRDRCFADSRQQHILITPAAPGPSRVTTFGSCAALCQLSLFTLPNCVACHNFNQKTILDDFRSDHLSRRISRSPALGHESPPGRGFVADGHAFTGSPESQIGQQCRMAEDYNGLWWLSASSPPRYSLLGHELSHMLFLSKPGHSMGWFISSSPIAR